MNTDNLGHLKTGYTLNDRLLIYTGRCPNINDKSTLYINVAFLLYRTEINYF